MIDILLLSEYGGLWISQDSSAYIKAVSSRMVLKTGVVRETSLTFDKETDKLSDT